MVGHLSKYRSLCPTWALICHVADNGTGAVTIEGLRRAIAAVEYLETHARRAYEAGLSGPVDTAKAILAKIQSGALKPPFTSKDVWRPSWTKLRDRGEVVAGLAMLVDYDWLVTEQVPTSRRPRTLYHLTPGAAKNLNVRMYNTAFAASGEHPSESRVRWAR